VQEERRQRVDNVPYGAVQEAILDLAYTNFGYKHSTIGSMADLNAATLQDVRDFFATYYAPSNAVLTVAGDFDAKNAKRLIEKHFGPLQRKPAPAPVDEAEPSRFSGERRKTLSDPLARQTLWRAAYVTVAGDDPDYWALNLLGTILGSGRTSPLYQATVEKNLALSAGGGQAEGRGPSQFGISALVAPGAKVEDVEAAVDAVIERIQKQGVTDEEMARARRAERAAFVQGYRGVRAKSNAIGEYSVYFNDPNRINTYLEKAVAVTTQDVQRAAQKYLTKNNRAVVIVNPAAAAAPAAPTAAAAAAAGKEAGK
jgi:predicted Zn-dependent peptidase